MVELMPKAVLQPQTRYEVVLAAEGRKEAVVGEFSTGTDEDHSPPKWDGTAKAAYFPGAKVCCNCSTGDPYAVIKMERPAGEAASYAIWQTNEAGKIDAAKAPLLYLRDWSGTLSLGHQSTCSAKNLRFPEKGGALHLGVAAVDLAGNRSTVSEVTITLPNEPNAVLDQ